MGEYGSLMPNGQEKLSQLGVTHQILNVALLSCSYYGE